MAMKVSNHTGILSGQSWVASPGSQPSRKPVFITYSFPTKVTPDDRQSWPQDVRKWRKFSKQDIKDAKAALKQWEKASGIKFLQTRADHGDIQFSWLPSASSAFAMYPDQYIPYPSQAAEFEYFYQSAGNVYLNTGYHGIFKTDPNFKKYILLHEIGHALGLKHSFDTTEHNSKILSNKRDSVKYTVMAYAKGEASPTQLKSLDKTAIKTLYGSPSNAGKHIEKWSWNSKREVLTQIGKTGGDTILGTSVTDIIQGRNGNDRLQGFYGNDQLSGGAGNDVLIGGPGRDAFLFDATPNEETNVDRITDFEASNDKFWLSKVIFKNVGSAGVLSADAFCIGKQAEKASHRIVFDRGYTGKLFYDADGSGPADQIAFAKIQDSINLQAWHFLIA